MPLGFETVRMLQKTAPKLWLVGAEKKEALNEA